MAEQEKDGSRQGEADGRAELRKHAVPGALAGRCVFDGEQDGAAPFAAEAEALAEAEEREQEWSGEVDAVVAG